MSTAFASHIIMFWLNVQNEATLNEPRDVFLTILLRYRLSLVLILRPEAGTGITDLENKNWNASWAVRDFRFSQRCCWRWQASGIWRRVGGRYFPTFEKTNLPYLGLAKRVSRLSGMPLFVSDRNVGLHHPCLSVNSYLLILIFVLNLVWMLKSLAAPTPL